MRRISFGSRQAAADVHEHGLALEPLDALHRPDTLASSGDVLWLDRPLVQAARLAALQRASFFQNPAASPSLLKSEAAP